MRAPAEQASSACARKNLTGARNHCRHCRLVLRASACQSCASVSLRDASPSSHRCHRVGIYQDGARCFQELGHHDYAMPAMRLEILTLHDEMEADVAQLHIMPSSLRSLTFGKAFDDNVSEVRRPLQLETLSFGFAFNRSLDWVALPASL